MRVTTVVFDVGETLVDETRNWEHAADVSGVPRFTLMALVGAAAARRESPWRAFEWLEVTPSREQLRQAFAHDELYPDALPCLRALREHGIAVGAAGNMGIVHEELLRPYVDFVSSSERWGVEKPSPAFFACIADAAGVPAEQIAYVGDLVWNDVEPALAAGMVAVHVRRGPWGYLHEPPPEAIRIRSLAELPGALP